MNALKNLEGADEWTTIDDAEDDSEKTLGYYEGDPITYQHKKKKNKPQQLDGEDIDVYVEETYYVGVRKSNGGKEARVVRQPYKTRLTYYHWEDEETGDVSNGFPITLPSDLVYALGWNESNEDSSHAEDISVKLQPSEDGVNVILRESTGAHDEEIRRIQKKQTIEAKENDGPVQFVLNFPYKAATALGIGSSPMKSDDEDGGDYVSWTLNEGEGGIDGHLEHEWANVNLDSVMDAPSLGEESIEFDYFTADKSKPPSRARFLLNNGMSFGLGYLQGHKEGDAVTEADYEIDELQTLLRGFQSGTPFPAVTPVDAIATAKGDDRARIWFLIEYTPNGLVAIAHPSPQKLPEKRIRDLSGMGVRLNNRGYGGSGTTGNQIAVNFPLSALRTLGLEGVEFEWYPSDDLWYGTDERVLVGVPK